jgi:hypothetical protein
MQITFNNLLDKQEIQIKAFERHREDMLKAVQTTEKELLQHYSCSYENAPTDVLNIIATLRKDYARNWSSDGVLINELMRRHWEQREKILNIFKFKKLIR